MTYAYPYQRPALTVDIVVLGVADEQPCLLVIRRAIDPFRGEWALPGGFVRIDETLEEAALRELSEETGLSSVEIFQVRAFSDLNRDPRERVVSIAFLGMVKSTEVHLSASTDATEAKWVPLHQTGLKLAFDHERIVSSSLDWLRTRLFQDHLALRVLPNLFTLTQVQNLYEGILNKKLDKRNFRKKILSSGLVRPTRKKLKQVSYRSPQLYSLKGGGLQNDKD